MTPINDGKVIRLKVPELTEQRRKELVKLIKDHSLISFDQLHRRFLKIPDRTLRYDLQQLEKAGFIQKVGTTRGAMYQQRKK